MYLKIARRLINYFKNVKINHQTLFTKTRSSVRNLETIYILQLYIETDNSQPNDIEKNLGFFDSETEYLASIKEIIEKYPDMYRNDDFRIKEYEINTIEWDEGFSNPNEN
jgi:hypothetical protein